jgi:hypothetical protein
MLTQKIKKLIKKASRQLDLLPFLFSPAEEKNNDLILVTGSDSSHAKSLFQFLASISKHEPNLKTIVFDLGLSESDREKIRGNFPAAELRLFDYSKYPAYFNIKINAGEYAWKPVIICDVLNEFKSRVCWMDAGNKLTSRLTWIRKITGAIGIYSPQSNGTIADWTHPKTLEFLKASPLLLDRPNLNGACIAANYRHPQVRELINQWKACALTKECIAPAGSSRQNHRQDQAVLSVLAQQYDLTRKIPTKFYGFKIHQDID